MAEEKRNTNPILVKDEEFVPYLKEEQIAARVSELASDIRRDFDGKTPIFVCVLNGAFIFFADLIRRVDIDCEVDFIKLSSYGEEKISAGNVLLLKDLNSEISGRHVIIVEDIVDSGCSIDYMKKLISVKEPASLAIATLLHKPDCTQVEHVLDYVGFEIPPRFVIGYGLDYAQKARNLPAIYMLPE